MLGKVLNVRAAAGGKAAGKRPGRAARARTGGASASTAADSTKGRGASSLDAALPKVQKHAEDVSRPTPLRVDDADAADAAVALEVSERQLVKAARKAVRDYEYERVLAELQVELVVLQEHIKHTGDKVMVIFEGRDAAGKGGAIKRITDAMSPRVCRVCALGVPTDKEKSQWYFQRYVEHLPSAGEMVLFDRSYYNRAGVERVMGFCTDEEYEEFMRSVPLFEEMITNAGVKLIKLWFDVSNDEQEKRFQARLERSWKRWKLSPMDLYARTRWFEYARARDAMFARTGTVVPWDIIPSDDKRSARLNAISHILASVDYAEVEAEPVVLPPREEDPTYEQPKWNKKHARAVPQIYSPRSLATDDGGRDWRDVAKELVVGDGEGRVPKAREYKRR